MTIPKYVPVWSTDGQTYDDPGAGHHGDPTRVEPSAGEQALGAVPLEPVDAETINWLAGTLGQHLAAIVDAHAFNWQAQPVYAESDLAANNNTATEPPLLYPAGDRWLVKTPDGGTGVAFHSRKHGQGELRASAADSSLFTDSANSSAGADAVIMTERTLARVVEITAAGNTARYSDDWGATWSAAGSLSGTATSTCGGYLNGAWHTVRTDVDGSHEVHSDTDLVGTWSVTDVDPSNTVDADSYRRFISSPDVAIFLPTGCGSQTDILVNDGGGWDVVTVPTTGATHLWRGDWNAHLGLFMITNLGRQCWVSADGVTWALAMTHTTAIYDCVASGRGWVISGVTEDFVGTATLPALWFVSYDSTQTVVAQRIGWESASVNYSRFHLIRFRGRVIAGRVNDTGGRLEWWESGTNLADLDANGY